MKIKKQRPLLSDDPRLYEDVVQFAIKESIHGYEVAVLPVKNHLKKLEEILFLIKEKNLKKQLTGNIRGKCITQCISAYFELDMYKLLEEAGLKPEFNTAHEEGNALPDLKILLTDNFKITIECTVLSEHYENITYQQYKSNQKDFHIFSELYSPDLENEDSKGLHIKPSKKNKDIYTNDSLESKEIQYFQSEIQTKQYNETISSGTLGQKDKNSLQQYFKNPQKLFDGRSMSFECQQDPLNRNSFSGIVTKLKNPIEQLKEVLDNKKRQLNNCDHPRIIAVASWEGSDLLIKDQDYRQDLKKKINEDIGYMSSEISAVLIIPNNFFPIGSITYRPNDFKEVFQLSNFQVIDEEGWLSFHNWTKDKRYIYFLKNPRAKYPIPSCFEKHLNQAIQVISI